MTRAMEQPTISSPPTSSPQRMLRSSMKPASSSPTERRVFADWETGRPGGTETGQGASAVSLASDETSGKEGSNSFRTGSPGIGNGGTGPAGEAETGAEV